MLNFKSYYSGSKGNLYSISDGETTLMLDCGVPWKKAQKAFNYKTSEVAGILLTHSHISDHAKGINDALKYGMSVYMSQGTFDDLQLKDIHNIHIIQAEKQFKIGTWYIKPLKAKHDTTEPLNFFMVSGCERAVYIIDTLYCEYNFTALTLVAIGCNYDSDILRDNVNKGLINPNLANRILSNHMSISSVKQFFLDNDMSQLQAVYLLHLSSANSDANNFKKAIQEIVGVPVYVAGE